VRGLGIPATALVCTLLLAGCAGSGNNDGGLPTPAEGGASEGSTATDGTPAPSSTPSGKPSTPVKTPAAPKAQVIVVPGNFADNPAVQGLVAKYPIYYKALMDRDEKVIKDTFPSFFYLDVVNSIHLAKSSGWVMRPPGSVVVMSVVQRPYKVVRLNLCVSQRTQYWNPKAKTWAKVAPKGMPEVIDMVETGLGWAMYRKLQPEKSYSCAAVRFPA